MRADHLRHVSRELGDGDLRPYLPKEVCKILKAVCQFNNVPLVLDHDGVDRVAAIYFTRAGELRSAEAEAASAAGLFVTHRRRRRDRPQPPAPGSGSCSGRRSCRGTRAAHRPTPSRRRPRLRPTPSATPPGAIEF